MRRLLLAALCVLALAGAAFRDNPLVGQAQGYAAEVATAAAASYVTLRSLNAFLSAAQELEVGVSFIASGTAQPLKVLEPVDDTVERVAGLVFGVMVITGVLAVSLGPVSALGLGALGVALGVHLAFGRRIGALPRRLAWYGGFLGLALPLSLIVAQPLAISMTETPYRTNLAIVEDITAGIGASEALEGQEPGLREYQQLASSLWSRADELISALLAIVGVHIFRLVILPVLLIVASFLIVQHFARPDHTLGSGKT